MRWHALSIVVVLLLITVGCQSRIIDSGSSPTPLPGSPVSGPGAGPVDRPDIPRVNMPEDMPDNAQQPAAPPANRTVFLPNGTPGAEFDVPLGHAIGEYFPTITAKQLLLLQHPVIRVDNNKVIGYDEKIRLDFGANSTGKVVFTKHDKKIGTFLKYEKGKPILEYKLQLYEGTFEQLQGRDIQVLGHTYVIAEATNETVSLFGKSVANNLFFENGQPLEANKSARSGTLVNVTPNAISFVVKYKDSDILLAPGEHISDTINKIVFGTDLLDVTYKGAPQLDGAVLELRKDDIGYTLVADTAGETLNLQLVGLASNGSIVLGSEDDPLRISNVTANISEGDRFIVTTSDGKTFLLTYDSISSKHLYIKGGNTRYDFEFLGTPGKDAVTDIVISGYHFPVRIGAKDNATGAANISLVKPTSDIVLRSGAILRIGAINSTGAAGNPTLPLQIIVPAAKTVDKRDQILRLNLTYNATLASWQAIVGTVTTNVTSNVTFVKDESDTIGITPYGTLIDLRRDNGSLPLNVGDDAILRVPTEPVYGIVSLEER